MATKPESYTQQLFYKLLERGDLGLAQVWFDAAVLDKYRGSPSFSVVRTDTIGRLSRERVWSLDFGIAVEDTLIHASLKDLLERLPEPERGHWAQHAHIPPASALFLQTRLAPGSCIDDGELRKWWGIALTL